MYAVITQLVVGIVVGAPVFLGGLYLVIRPPLSRMYVEVGADAVVVNTAGSKYRVDYRNIESADVIFEDGVRRGLMLRFTKVLWFIGVIPPVYLRKTWKLAIKEADEAREEITRRIGLISSDLLS